MMVWETAFTELSWHFAVSLTERNVNWVRTETVYSDLLSEEEEDQ